jgi:lactobin A/cerein 7B family class IIb bacteriocin
MKHMNDEQLQLVSGGNILVIVAAVVVTGAVAAYTAGYAMGYESNHLDGECRGG